MPYLLFVLPLIGFHGLFVVTEYAFVKAARSRSEHRYLKKHQEILLNLEEHLLVCQIGKTLTLMSMGVCLGFLFQNIINQTEHLISITQLSIASLAFIGVAIVQMVLGFELPKLLGVMNSDKCVVSLSGYLRLCSILLEPLAWTIRRFRPSNH